MTVTELREPRTDSGPRAGLRVLVAAREQMASERTRAINTLTALQRAFDLGVDARRRLSAAQIRQVAAWRSRPGDDIASPIARAEVVRLATQIRLLADQLTHNQDSLTALVEAFAPELLTQPGVGPVVAADVLTAWSHPGRVRSEAA